MAQHYLFASVDAPPRLGGVAALAEALTVCLSAPRGSEGVFVAPLGSGFEKRTLPFRFYEDFQSDTKLRDGPGSATEDGRIEALFTKLIEAYKINQLILWHPFYYGIGGIRAARTMGIPSAVYCHGTELTSQIPEVFQGEVDFNFNPRSEDLPQRLYAALSTADKILTNSHFTKSLLERLLPEKPVIVTGCGITKQTYDRETARMPAVTRVAKTMAREDAGLEERPTLVHLGRLVPHKNQKQSIDLVAEMDNAQLLILGEGPMEAELRNYAMERGLAGRVIFLGSVSERDKWAYLRASDAGLLVSDLDERTGGYEGFGIVMLEYAAAGCLPCSNGFHGMSDFISRYQAGHQLLHDGRPVAEHAAELQTLITSPEELQSKIDQTRTIIETRYLWDKVADRIRKGLEGDEA